MDNKDADRSVHLDNLISTFVKFKHYLFEFHNTVAHRTYERLSMDVGVVEETRESKTLN